MCINENFPVAKEQGQPIPCYGEIVTITKEFHTEWGLYYELEGYPKDYGYDADKFIPLSEIDEREMVRERDEIFIKQNIPF